MKRNKSKPSTITLIKQTYYILLIWCIVHYRKVLNNDLTVPEKIIAPIFLLLSTKTSYSTLSCYYSYVKYYDEQINTLLFKELKNLLKETKTPTYYPMRLTYIFKINITVGVVIAQIVGG